MITNGDEDILAYIIITRSDEMYCGKTKDIKRRLDEHIFSILLKIPQGTIPCVIKEKYPHWFSFKDRKFIKRMLIFNGDYEKRIKEFGNRNFVKCLGTVKEIWPPSP